MPVARFDPRVDYYAVLDLDETCTTAQIKRAFHDIALECHPDRAGDNQALIEKFREASAAHAVLIDPDLRAAYDDARRAMRGARIGNVVIHTRFVRSNRVVVVRTSHPPEDPRDAPWRQQTQADLNRMRDEINANAMRMRDEINANALRMRDEINANALRMRDEINANALRHRRAMQENRARVRAEMASNAEACRTAATASADQARSRVEEAGGSDLIRAHAPAPAPGGEGRGNPVRELSAREVGRENDDALARSRRIVLGTGVVGLVTSAALSGVLASTTAMNSSIAIAVGCACGMIPFFIVFGIVLKKMSSMG